MKIVVGLDPGVSGGIAWNIPNGPVSAVGGPEPDEICNIARTLAGYGVPMELYVEAVTGFIKPPKGAKQCEKCGAEVDAAGKCANRQPGHTMFTFGHNTGQATGIFRMAGASIHPVNARAWQKPLFLGKLKGPERKAALAEAARKRFPNVKVTLKTADALLLHAYGMLLEHETVRPLPSMGPQKVLEFTDDPGDEDPDALPFEPLPEMPKLDPGVSRYLAPWKDGAFVLIEEQDGIGSTAIRKATPEDLRIYATR